MVDCLGKRDFTSSESKYNMGRPVKGLTNSLDLRTQSSNKKQKEKFAITDMTYQDFSKFINNFKNSPYLDLQK